MAAVDSSRPTFLQGGGALGELIANFAWETTDLGPIDGWPAHVRHTVSLLLRSALPMVALFGPQGTMVYNESFSQFGGARHPRMLGAPVCEAWPEAAAFNDNVLRVGLSGGTLSYKDQEFTLFRHGVAEQVWVNLDYSPVMDDENRPAAVLSIVVETTGKVRAEQRLSGARARLAEMFEQAPGFICTLSGPDHVFEFANAAYRKLFPREPIGLSARAAFPEIEGQGFFERLDEVYRTGHPYHGQAVPMRMAGKDGGVDEKHVTFVYQPLFDEDGTVTGVFCEGFDVSDTVRANDDLHRTQAWLHEGLQAARMVAFEWEFASGLARYSPNAQEVLGYGASPSSPDVGFSSVHPDDLTAFRGAIAQARESGGDYQLVHRRMRPDTGALMWTDTRGRIYGGSMRGVVIDVTERVRSEEALRQANRRKDEFLAMLAHELRNPLAPISTGTALLMRAAGDEEAVRRTSALIERQVRHMSELVDDLLDVSRVTRGLIEIERQPVGLRGVVHSALEQARPVLEWRRHDVAVQVPDTDVIVMGDRTRLVQVLVNLLTNAAKYTPPQGAIRVELSQDGVRASLSVTDDGVGIEPSLLPHVFDLFTQGAVTPDRSQGGLGIGLALVKSIVDMHGGDVLVESDGKGKGSRFTIALSLPPIDQAAAPRASPPPSAPGTLRILVTDDNADAADSLASLLRMVGHQVDVAYSGGEALAAVDRAIPDVCVLDVGLPDITGLDLARELRSRPALDRTRLVALTGYGQPQDREATAKAGFDEHFVKPVAPARLEEMLSRHARSLLGQHGIP